MLRPGIVDMKINPLVIVAAAVVAVIYFGNLGAAGGVLEYYIQAVDFTGITTGSITLVIQNPSNANITLNSMAGTIAANGTTIGNISNFQGGISIPANQQVPVKVFVNISLLGIISDLYSILTQPTGITSVDFLITGTANINGGILLPFSIAQSINV